MPTLNINEEQVLSLIDQLSSDQQTQLLQKLFQKQQTNWEFFAEKGQIAIRKIAQEKNRNWETMTEDEQEDFINDLIHEDRLCAG
jgi:hypothetical protein